MPTPESEPREVGPRVVRLGEPFAPDFRPVNPQTREKNYPRFFEETIAIPELGLNGELYLYSDGCIAHDHVTPLGPIDFQARVWGNAVAFDEQQGGPLMLHLVLKGNDNIDGRQMVVESEDGTYTAKAKSYGHPDTQEPYSSAGAHTWDSSEKYPEQMRTDSRYEKKNVTAYFPPDEARLKEAKITLY